MPKRCVVACCDTGTKRCRKKCSVFKVPANENLRKKWAAAIPGVVYLKPSQHVCEKHFEEKFIERKWIKRDADGRIIAEVPYKHIRLAPGAIPSIFIYEDEDIEESTNRNAGVAILEVAEADGDPNLLINQCISDHKQQVNVLLQDHCYCSAPCEGEQSSSEKENNNINLSSTTAPVQMETENNRIAGNVPETESSEFCENIDLVSGEVIKDTNDEALFEHRLTSEEPIESVGTEIVSDTNTSRVVEESPRIEPNAAAIPVMHFTVMQEVQVHFWIDSSPSENNFVTTLPSTWCATALPGDKTLVISQICASTETRIPVLRKSITITRERVMTYYVHGKVIENGRQGLPQILETPEILPSIVLRFQSLQVCYGLGNIDIGLARADVALKDNMNMLRASNCMLIGVVKKCKFCTKLRKILKQKEARYAKRGVVNRVSNASNPIDNNKLNIMRKKLKLEQRRKNRTTSRLTNLLDRLSGLQNEVAAVQNQSLKERLASFDVQTNDETALQEIIAAAKKNPKGRRYSQEWLMLCMLMNVRSPSFYDFLRKNRIIPLPCTRTIGRYLAIINSNSGFDERFSSLLQNRLESKKPTQCDALPRGGDRKFSSLLKNRLEAKKPTECDDLPRVGSQTFRR